ncbi:SDR family oxidoreductase [Pedobacter sp. B4-66]|uniref:SDR family oxidoreductase n=1 Tax=Pedobacter sp. B4-66 TaxID=2817280 RepID=UPI001BDA8A1D|nr:SDR family oxidoreductase [Pedobacter sp. B4-66]
MKIVVIGGTGLIGTKLVKTLSEAGHEVLAASPATGVNAITGEGLATALTGADIVVDVANSPSFEQKAVFDFFETSGRNLIAAEKDANVKHHVALSVVGTDRPNANTYFQAKLAQEKLIQESGIPYSILHATQFFEFVGGIAQAGTQGDQIHVSPALFQPIAAEDVVAALAEVTTGSPLNGSTEVAGPEKIGLDEIVRQYLGLKNDTRQVISDVHAPYFGAEINDQSLVPGDQPRIGKQTYGEWIRKPGNLR